MDSKKYEQLINFIINEEEDKAKELFHEIVVEQSRGIYESIMAEEMMGVDEEDLYKSDDDLYDIARTFRMAIEDGFMSKDDIIDMVNDDGKYDRKLLSKALDMYADAMEKAHPVLGVSADKGVQILKKAGLGRSKYGISEEEDMGGDVGDLMDEITAEESGVAEDEESEEMDSEDSESEEIFDLDSDSEEDESSEEVEDAVVRIEDKLDELMGEFEEILGKMDGDGEEKEEVEVDSEEEVEVDSEDEDMMQEAIQLQKVSPHHGDDGDQKQSPVAANSGKKGMDSNPVNYSGGGDEKGRSAPQTKDVKNAGSFKNAPAGKAKVDLSSAPKPVTKDGAQNDKSPYAK